MSSILSYYIFSLPILTVRYFPCAISSVPYLHCPHTLTVPYPLSPLSSFSHILHVPYPPCSISPLSPSMSIPYPPSSLSSLSPMTSPYPPYDILRVRILPVPYPPSSIYSLSPLPSSPSPILPVPYQSYPLCFLPHIIPIPYPPSPLSSLSHILPLPYPPSPLSSILPRIHDLLNKLLTRKGMYDTIFFNKKRFCSGDLQLKLYWFIIKLIHGYTLKV